MTDTAFTRCARPHLTARRISTYTILGWVGHAVANLVGSALALHWELTLGERLVAFFVPPLAFIAVVAVSSALAGCERIVFYRTAVASIAAVAVLGELTGARIARLVDLVTLGIGIFLVFGRLGCHAVACCHGTLGRGVTYGPPHVTVGFSPRWCGRALWPVQLAEATASGALVLAGLSCSAEPGRAALVYALGYAVVRFVLELLRGDGARPYVLGVSEAQWIAVASALACAAWRPGIVPGTIAAALAATAGTLIVRRHRRELLLPGHRGELEQALVVADSGERRETSLGVAVSRHLLPDGRTDWVLSSEHRYWSAATARSLAHLLWPSFELLPGHTPNVFPRTDRIGDVWFARPRSGLARSCLLPAAIADPFPAELADIAPLFRALSPELQGVTIRGDAASAGGRVDSSPQTATQQARWKVLARRQLCSTRRHRSAPRQHKGRNSSHRPLPKLRWPTRRRP